VPALEIKPFLIVITVDWILQEQRRFLTILH